MSSPGKPQQSSDQTGKASFSLTLAILIALFNLTPMAYSQSATTNQSEMKTTTPITNENFRVYRADGQSATLADIVKAMADSDAALLGETHDDPVAHYLEAELLRLAYESQAAKRPLVLSLEMFERDVQTVLDEYLASLITETHFLRSSRPWDNYQGDYRPMIEYAKEHKFPVIAANAPRRYVNRVTRLGMASLDALSPQAKAWLPPLPYADASPAYVEKFRNLMGQMPSAAPATPSSTPGPALASQSLWDASMAHAISEQLKQRKDALVIHVNGKFHSEERMGIPDHLSRYRPNTRTLIVTMVVAPSYPELDVKSQTKLGDFVIFTDGRLPRSYQAETGSRR
jgi:uncharacterized iron-regulated protein